MMFRSFALAAALVGAVSAHSTFQELWVDGVDEAGSCVYTPTSNSPVTGISTAAMTCNTHTAATAKCDVTAGGKVAVEMHAQPNDRSCSNDAIGGNHDGPAIVYMAKVDDALADDFSSANWFKVAELGLISKDYWGTDSLNDNCGQMEFTVPDCLAPGDYLIRAEVIALHVASSEGGAQFYMSCYPVTVTGSGSTVPTDTITFPGGYSSTDPGILFNLYGTYDSYEIPGPAVFTC